MAQRKGIPGLRWDGKQWIIDKRVRGYGRIFERTGTSDRAQAETRLAQLITAATLNVTRQAEGLHTFREAATKHLMESTKRSLSRDAYCLKAWDPLIGDLPLDRIHMDTLRPGIEQRRTVGMKSSTVRRELAVIRRVLTLAARLWRDNQGRPWLTTAPPLFEMPDWEDEATPYPLTWEEQARLLQALPPYLANMALFAVNTGLREQGICWLRWEWETRIPELDSSVFITPGRRIEYPDGTYPGEKNKEDQLVVLNRIARSVIDRQRGLHSVYVFPYHEARLPRMHGSAWKSAWKRAGLPTSPGYTKGPHNLKHTFGRRLRHAGVPLETRKVLLHHTSGDITIHYSPADIRELIEAVERLCEMRPATMLRRAI